MEDDTTVGNWMKGYTGIFVLILTTAHEPILTSKSKLNCQNKQVMTSAQNFTSLIFEPE
jgi:hypothetical protein